jgi:hypothetical protein
MRNCDQFGVPLSRGDAEAIRHYDTAVAKLLTFTNDPVAEIDRPDDALAMMAAHQSDFFLGQSVELRDRVARRLGSIDKGSWRAEPREVRRPGVSHFRCDFARRATS